MNVTINWDLPTPSPQQRPIASTRIEVSADAGANFAELANVPAADQQQASMSDVPAGDWLVRLTVIDDSGAESAGVTEPFNVPFEGPDDVTNVTITVDG